MHAPAWTYRAAPVLAATLWLAPGPGAAQSAAAEAASQPAATAPALQPKVAPLLGLVLNELSSAAFTAVTGDSPAGLFRRQLEKLGLWRSGTDVARADTAAPAKPAMAAASGALGRPGQVVPVVGYAVEQLDPVSFKPLRQLDVARTPPALRTQDVFALQYSTNLPGQVRLENVDPAGERHDLGVYNVAPDQLNRLPRTEGIKLIGQPGVEQIRVYFYPCLPAGFEDAPWMERLRERLPACGRGPNPLLAAAAGGALQAKALVNLAQPDEKTSFAGTDEYQPNEVTLTVAHIRHERP